jgi:hypothetical protein
MFRSSRDVHIDSGTFESFLEQVDGLLDNGLPLGKFFPDPAADLVVHVRIEDLVGKVLEFPLDLVDAESVRERRVDLDGLLGDAKLLVPPKGLQRPHVVHPIRKFDEDHPDILGHDEEHLAQIFRLVVLEGTKGELAELRDSINEGEHLCPKFLFQRRRAEGCVLKDIMQKRRHERISVELHVRKD